jgi:hypothetical protein
MADEAKKNDETNEKMCAFAPDQGEAAPEDAILYRKPRTYEELKASSDRCCAHVSERLDQIEEEINAAANKGDK